MSCHKISVITLVLLLSFSSALSAQKVEVGAGLGSTYYKGDLNPTIPLAYPGAALRLFGRYNTDHISIKGYGAFNHIVGNDAKSKLDFNKTRNYRFQQQIFDYALQLEYNFFRFRNSFSITEKESTPYIFIGGGQYYPISNKHISDAETIKRELRNPNMIIAYGLGYKWAIRGQWNLEIEFSSKFIFDQFVSKKNKNADNALDGLGYRMSDNGPIPTSYYTLVTSNTNTYRYDLYPNSVAADKYFNLTVGISYLFYKVRCPRKLR